MYKTFLGSLQIFCFRLILIGYQYIFKSTSFNTSLFRASNHIHHQYYMNNYCRLTFHLLNRRSWTKAQSLVLFTFDKTLLLIFLIDNKQPGISKLFTFTKSSFYQMCPAHTSLPGNSNLSQNLYYHQVFCILNFFGLN